MYRWNTFTNHLKRRFGQRVQKIPLDAGASCPNRDGTLSRAGCAFCNAAGSGSGLGLAGMNIPAQWAFWRNHFHKSRKAFLYLAYLQSFSNTYGPVSRLEELLTILDGLPDLVGISVGTRPDCMDSQKAALLASRGWPETWLELGVQSMNDRTLAAINRGHNAAASARAIEVAANAGLQVCAHMMLGLPGENLSNVIATTDALNALPIAGIKLHNTYVCAHTALEREFLSGCYRPLDKEEYAQWASEVLIRLRPDILVHRVVADPAPGELVAPAWAACKAELVRLVEHAYHEKRVLQDGPPPPELRIHRKHPGTGN